MQQDSKLKLLAYKLGLIIPDRIFAVLKYRKALRKWPDLKSPKTFNEKLTWLKLNDHNPMYTQMVDKYTAKKYVSGIIGSEYIIPTLGIWDRAEEIDFDSLPDKFVIKATHDSGRVIICKDKSKLDKAHVISEMKKSLKRNFYAVTREWPYKNVRPRIIAEKLLEIPGSHDLADYKIHNFNGEPKLILVCRNRFGSNGLTEDFFDSNWNHLSVRRPNHPNAAEEEERPKELSEMIELSRKLSKGYPFMRTDFYVVNGKIYFGEITLYPASGATPFVPEEYDLIFGRDLNINYLSNH